MGKIREMGRAGVRRTEVRLRREHAEEVQLCKKDCAALRAGEAAVAANAPHGPPSAASSSSNDKPAPLVIPAQLARPWRHVCERLGLP